MTHMRSLRSVATATLILAWMSIVNGQSGSRITGTTGQTVSEKEVRTAEEQMHRAYVTGDVALFSSLYSEDATFTYNSGQTVGAKERVARFAEQAKSGAFKDLRDDIVSIATIGDVALVRCVSRYSSASGSGESHLTILRVWHKRNGRWQVVAFQSTAVRPEGAAQ
jgi:uncharacterized protein (TIGR02246 family)